MSPGEMEAVKAQGTKLRMVPYVMELFGGNNIVLQPCAHLMASLRSRGFRLGKTGAGD
jgi:hypothetical protein